MDWIATVLEVIGVWKVGNKSRWGFVYLLICNLAWILVAYQTKLYGMLTMMIIFVFINIRNFIKWSNDEHLRKKVSTNHKKSN